MERKRIRLKGYDYNLPGYYFITICTKNRQKLLCDIVGTGLPDGPAVHYSQYGQIVLTRLEKMTDFYEDIKIDKYVIMPNHVHLLLCILEMPGMRSKISAPSNAKISRFIGTFKRFCNRDMGQNIWQGRSHDHIVRGEADYRKIWEYIDNNPARWAEDCFHCI